MKMILKSMHLEFFKGVQDKTYSFGNPITRIKAMNGRGKTTIADAFMWVLFDKSYALVSNPNIRPNDVEECTPTVTLVLDIDGKEVTISKAQKRKVSKPDVLGVSKVTLSNTYEVNSVPKTERDFKAYMEEAGIDFETALVCIHPSVFTSQKATDMRKVLFKMASEKTDKDIADMSRDTADVAKLLESYSLEEITAMNKASKKKADEQCKSIPDQIIGMEKSKVDIDVAELELSKNVLEEKITSCEEKLKSNGRVVDDLKSQKFDLGFTINDCKRRANDEIRNQRRDIDDKLFQVTGKFQELHTSISVTERAIAEKKKQIETLESERLQLADRYRHVKARVFDAEPYKFDPAKYIFDEASTICSLCGQPLPETTVAERRETFEKNKAKAMSDASDAETSARVLFDQQKKQELSGIEAQGTDKKNQIEALTKEVAELTEKLPSLRNEETDYLKIKNECESKLAELPQDADMTSNEEYVALKKKDAELDAQIADAEQNGVDTTAIEQEKSTYTAELESVKSKIAQSANNVRIDAQISELQEKQRDYEQAKADAEKILDQINQVSKMKNELLVSEINQHFSKVTWKLFDYQKNGEYKECCVPMIDGFRFGESTNTGREIVARLDICDSLQKFFGTSYPIFLDNAESLNDFNLPVLDTQVVSMKVSEDAEMVVE